MNLTHHLPELEKEFKETQNLKKKLEKEISKLPSGNLRCAKKKGSFQYYIGKKYLDKSQKSLITKIATREYYEQLLKIANTKLMSLQKLKKLLLYDYEQMNNLYENLHPGRKAAVSPLLKTKKEYIENWINVEYPKWIITDEDTSNHLYTLKKERVRSKSEKIIADELTKYGVPYRYEFPLTLNDGNRTVIRRPDFVALNPFTLEEKIIEHLGMLDKEAYYEKNLDKLALYERNGYLIGKNLILLHETSTSPLNTKILDQYIEEFLQ